MSSSKNRLGKGLASLLGDELDSMDRSEVSKDASFANVADLSPSPFQPRQVFDEISLKELSESIKRSGLVQPILVRKDATASGKFEIIAGERRWRAAQQAKLDQVPVLVRDLTDQECVEAALIENTQRDDLNPMEEARAYQNLKSKFSYSVQSMSEKLGKSRPYVANLMRLLDLPSEVQQLVESGSLAQGHARALIGHPQALDLAQQAVEQDLSVRQVEALVKTKSIDGSKLKTIEQPDPNIQAIVSELEGLLGMKVSLKQKDGRGSLGIHFKNTDQFEALLQRLSD